jgi:hypothetical protein
VDGNKMINNRRRVTTKVSLATKIINEQWRQQAMMKVSLTTHCCPSTGGGGRWIVTIVDGNSNDSGLADDDKQPQRVAANSKVSSCFLL